ncbi:MAG: HAMP domain-containing histidine kinase [Nitrospinae bacterium]|nr:HAMP domain-containing histidine kinase [Nitrospinota bacterium]
MNKENGVPGTTEADSRLSEIAEFNNKILSVISHDLRSPLSSTIGLIRLLLRRDKEPLSERQENILRVMERSAVQQMSFIENLVEISRIERGLLEAHPSPVPAARIVRRALEIVSAAAKEKGIGVSDESDGGLWIEADEEKAVHIVHHLLTNAVKFTNRGGWIKIQTKREGDLVLISVSDNGVGMDPAKTGKLFDLASKCGTLGTDGEKGTGLGLAICKKLAALMACGICVESTPGNGTTVTLSFKKANQA